MAYLMKKLKTGKLSALSQQTIHPLEDYEVTDIAEGGITNAQMTLALDESAGSFFKIGSVYLCIDEGTYTKHCFYKWNGIDASTPWEVVGSFDSKQDKLTAGTNITIGEDNVISASGSLYLHRIYFTGSPNRQFSQVRFSVLCSKSTAFSDFNDFCSYFADKYQFMPILSKGILMYASIASDRIALNYPTITSTLNEDNTITSVIDYNSRETTYSNNSGTMFDEVSPV